MSEADELRWVLVNKSSGSQPSKEIDSARDTRSPDGISDTTQVVQRSLSELVDGQRILRLNADGIVHFTPGPEVEDGTKLDDEVGTDTPPAPSSLEKEASTRQGAPDAASSTAVSPQINVLGEPLKSPSENLPSFTPAESSISQPFKLLSPVRSLSAGNGTSTSTPTPSDLHEDESENAVAGPVARGPSISLRGLTPTQGAAQLYRDRKYELVPLSLSPISPARRIVLSSGPSSVAYLNKKDEAPSSVYRAVPVREDLKPRTAPAGEPVNQAFVVLGISRKTRDTLIARGVYDPFRDDWYENDSRKRRSGMQKWLHESGALVRGSKGASARARPPESIPDRFLLRSGPALVEPWASVLTAASLLNRLGEYVCGWKGCGALLNSENNLVKHVRIREHAMQGVFTVGQYGEIVLYRCHWRDCDGPCFDSVQDLLQHITAVHTSKVLVCPYGECTLRSHNVSHLQRHVMKQHDDDIDEVRVRVDMPWRPEPKPLPPLPASVRPDELITAPIRPAAARTAARAEWVRNRVLKNCFAGEDPVLHVVHPPPMLQHIESGTVTPLSQAPGNSTQNGDSEAELVPVRRKKRKRIFGTKPKYVAKKSKLSHAFDLNGTDDGTDDFVDSTDNVSEERPTPDIAIPPRRHAVSRVYVDIPFIRPFRRRGEPVHFYDLPDPSESASSYDASLASEMNGELGDLAEGEDAEEEEEEEMWQPGTANKPSNPPRTRPTKSPASTADHDDDFHSCVSSTP